MDLQADIFDLAFVGIRISIVLLIFFGLIYFLIKMCMDNTTPTTNKVALIKTLYLYLVSFVALMMLVVSAVDLLNIVLKTFIFTKADSYLYYNSPVACPVGATTTYDGKDCAVAEREAKTAAEENQVSQRQRDLVRDISMLVVGIPLFVFHWKLARRKEI